MKIWEKYQLVSDKLKLMERDLFDIRNELEGSRMK